MTPLRHRHLALLLLTLAVAWVGMETAMRLHHMQVAHVVCPLDGEFIHVDTQPRDEPLQLRDARFGHEHHDYTVSNFATAESAPWEPTLRSRSWTKDWSRRGAPTQSEHRVSPLRDAPKTSPPAST